MSETEDKIAAARRYYNSVVQRFNTRIQVFPARLIAGSRSSRGSPSRRGTRCVLRGRPRVRSDSGAKTAVTLQQQIRANRRRTIVVLALFGLLVALIAGFAYQPSAIGIIGIIALTYGVVSSFAAGSMIAAVSGAHEAGRDAYPEACRTPTSLRSPQAGRERHRCMGEDGSPNACAAGRDAAHAYVAVTTGLLETMPRRELEGVLAHEVSHIRNRDVRLMSLAAVLVGIVALTADMIMRMTFFGGVRNTRRNDTNAIAAVLALVAALLAPLAAVLLEMSLSRSRDFQADASAAEITGDGEDGAGIEAA